MQVCKYFFVRKALLCLSNEEIDGENYFAANDL